MSEKSKNYANIIGFSAILVLFLILSLFMPDKESSLTERRLLKQAPELSLKTVLEQKGQASFMNAFEEYASDQFAFRDELRSLYSITAYYGLQKAEVNDIFYKGSGIYKTALYLEEENVSRAMKSFSFIRDKYLTDNQVYVSLIPDKNYYLEEGNYFDFDRLQDMVETEMSDYAMYIKIADTLSLDDYYNTDTHWKQEKLYETVNHLLVQMGMDVPQSVKDKSLTEKVFSDDYKGVYYGQGGLYAKSDTLTYLTGDYLDSLKVTCLDSGKEETIDLYDEELAKKMDAYEIFLSGSKSFIEIENPAATSEKELIIFRDSFGSSIAPLLAGSYKKVTLIDIRYINPQILGNFVDFEDKDILFLYCGSAMNSGSIK